jgi:DNA-binding transcriptional ArsR family regulator
MHIVKEENGEIYSIPTKEVNFLGPELAIRILTALAKKPSYPKEVAKLLKEDEQKIYYHIRKLEEKGLVKVIRKEIRGAALAKYYSLTKPSFTMVFGSMELSKKLPKSETKLFYPFITDGKLNSKIVIGSPDPHGPERARSRDVSYAMDFALFLGTFLNRLEESSIYLDTEISSMKDNLIIIGGPVTNRITKKINEKLPIRFDKKKNIYSSLTKKTYRNDDCGFIVKTKNPYDETKSIMVIAGKRYSGTRAAILAFLKNFDKLSKSHVVEGIDEDSDGVIDSVKILE